MSRSYKKVPRSGDKKDKFFKNYANRKLRRDKFHNFDHNNYKKNFCSWNICDFESIDYSFNAWWKHCVARWMRCGQYRGEPYPSKQEEYRLWYKWYKQK